MLQSEDLVFRFDVAIFGPGGGDGFLISRQDGVNGIVKNFKEIRQQFRNCLGHINSKLA